MILSNIIFDICSKIIDNSPDNSTYKALCLVCKIFWNYSEFSLFLIKVPVRVFHTSLIKPRYRNIYLILKHTFIYSALSFPNIKIISINTDCMYTTPFMHNFDIIFPNLEEFDIRDIGLMDDFVFPNLPKTCKKLLYGPDKVYKSTIRINSISSLVYYGDNIYHLLNLIDILARVKNISIKYYLFISYFKMKYRDQVKAFIIGNTPSILINDDMLLFIKDKAKLHMLDINLFIIGYGLIKIEKIDKNNVKLIKGWVI